ncbi:MAG: glycosyltransferase family protein [Gammaproteobacteria bacterium]|nr:glycosyltransferase family protein [Gammaproteobacteria bacterium]
MAIKHRTVALVQARMSSSRLPGKVLTEIHGKPMIARVVERTRQAKRVDFVAVATTVDPADDAIETWCRQSETPCYRGSMFDVLDRFYQAAKFFAADVIVRVTADCPVIDPQVIDKTIEAFHANQADFAANRLPPPWGRTYPIGLDTEVCSFSALERAWKEASEAHEREHVMPYLYDVDGRFKVFQINTSPDYGALRWTVDTPEDLKFMQSLFAFLPDTESFTWLDVLKVTRLHPELEGINADVQHKVFNEVDERMNGNEG